MKGYYDWGIDGLTPVYPTADKVGSPGKVLRQSG
jgi:hypothetical protein